MTDDEPYLKKPIEELKNQAARFRAWAETEKRAAEDCIDPEGAALHRRNADHFHARALEFEEAARILEAKS